MGDANLSEEKTAKLYVEVGLLSNQDLEKAVSTVKQPAFVKDLNSALANKLDSRHNSLKAFSLFAKTITEDRADEELLTGRTEAACCRMESERCS